MDVAITRESEDGPVAVTLRRDESVDTVTYASDDVVLAPRAEAAVAGLLLVAMANGEDIHVKAPLDPLFLDNLSTVQDIYTTWADSLSRVEVHAEERRDTISAGRRSGGRVAAFFSGGVDSFYTLLKHVDEIDALIFVHGFDVKLNDTALRSTVSRRLNEVAEALGKQLIEVETSLRKVTNRGSFTPEFNNWELSHGSALASVAHVLGSHFERIYVPASHTYSHLFPWGSHPVLDPLWSAGSLVVEHDGAEASRVEKCKMIARSDEALQTLRVCWKNIDGAYNCGRCEKCLRTMINLKAVGALSKAQVFDRKLDLRRVSKVHVKDESTRAFVEENVKYLKASGSNPELVTALEKALRRSALRRRIGPVLQPLRRGVNSMRNFIGV